MSDYTICKLISRLANWCLDIVCVPPSVIKCKFLSHTELINKDSDNGIGKCLGRKMFFCWTFVNNT